MIVSDPTMVLVEHDLPDGVSLRDLGTHRLKDLNLPMRLHDLVVAGLGLDVLDGLASWSTSRWCWGPARAKARAGAGGIAWWQEDIAAARRFYEEALAIERRLGDPARIADALYNPAFVWPPGATSRARSGCGRRASSCSGGPGRRAGARVWTPPWPGQPRPGDGPVASQKPRWCSAA